MCSKYCFNIGVVLSFWGETQQLTAQVGGNDDCLAL